MATPDIEKDRNDVLAALIRQAGPRTQPNAALEAKVRAAVHDEWRRGLHRRRLRQTGKWLAAAAVAAIAVTIGWRGPVVSRPAVEVATLAFAHGEVRVNSNIVTTVTKTSIHSGDEFATGATSGARLALNNRASIRLAASSHIHWIEADKLELIQGAMYVDSGPRHVRFEVATPFGTITHMGTRYQLSLSAQSLKVGVRDGVVELQSAQRKETTKTGQELSIDRSGRVTRDKLAPFGESWAWVDDLAPHFDIENRSLDDFLKWAASETGRTLNYADAATEGAATSTFLHGSSGVLAPREAIAAILPTTDFVAREYGESLIISKQ